MSASVGILCQCIIGAADKMSTSNHPAYISSKGTVPRVCNTSSVGQTLPIRHHGAHPFLLVSA
jgi:hypothetical protein